MLDACQSVGQMPVDVRRVGCHFLSGTGRKFLRAPRGTGFLYCASSCLDRFEPAALDSTGAAWAGPASYEMRPTAARFQSYEMSAAAKVGLGVAVQRCLDVGIERIWRRVARLAATLRALLAALPGVTVHDHGAVLCGIVSFAKAGVAAGEAQRRLQQQGVNTSVSGAPSTLLDFRRRGLQEVVRASVHYYNTEAEVRKLVAAVAAL